MFILEGMTPISGGICAAKGFSAGGVNAKIKPNSEKNDLAMIYCVKKCKAAALYTTNKVQGAPIKVTKKHLENGIAQAVIVNSGNANTCNANGIEIAELMCELTADTLHIDKEDVIVASTGVIGQPLSREPFVNGIPYLFTCLTDTGSDAACEAIMTTDTRKKEFALEFEIDGKICHIGAISKGSGMINPNMATMLAFITTDVNIDGTLLAEALRDVNDKTYNRVSVDGDTSTNDMVAIMASGLAENREITDNESEMYIKFVGALYMIMLNLARETARDGEGATKLIECSVIGANDEETAVNVANSVVSSSLLKAAISAADANWGRVLCAVGYAKGDFDPEKISVKFKSEFGEVLVCKNGCYHEFSEDEAYKILSSDEVGIVVDLGGEGEHIALAWGCDLTKEYVKINAEYRS